MEDISVKLNEFPTIHVSLGNVTVNQYPKPSSHANLKDRDLADQHPISAIAGLSDALASSVNTEKLDKAVASALAEAKESGIFDGDEGRSAYSYAQDGGYTGTEEEFAEKLASESPGIHIGPEAPESGELVWIDTDEEEQDNSAKSSAPDFSANEGEEGHILNRTHFVDENGVVHKLNNKYIDADWMATSEDHTDVAVVIPEQKISGGFWNQLQYSFNPGIVYDVYINEIVYPCECHSHSDGGYFLGNGALSGDSHGIESNEPFCIFWAGGTATGGFFYRDSSRLDSSVLLKVTEHSYTVYNKLPEGFLPDVVVKSVNGAKPDENGNVTVDAAGSSANIDVTAKVGQTIVVKEVDENGKPTKWKAADYQPSSLPYYVDIDYNETSDTPFSTTEKVDELTELFLSGREIKARLKLPGFEPAAFIILNLILHSQTEIGLALGFGAYVSILSGDIFLGFVPGDDGIYTVTDTING